ncbi:MAG TPA: thiopeptide-type bacteriocin biosynthesis protein [Candidatus Baltobacteraceae bacterium]|jgi:thiopeptide-type bacteriocin biosynthesis protein|nr:thiopeptide-type bacteriocin biosynthesis protein [Candidatus Baltobacteraceae bacterium]
MESNISPQMIEKGILAVLAGASLHKVAACISMEPANLADAAGLYQAAGYAAIEGHLGLHNWHQVWIEFARRDISAQIAVHLGSQMQQAEMAGIISSWWFIRKAPCWRLRCRPGSAATLAEMKAFIGHVLDGMLSLGLIVRTYKSIYEPETYAFGGPIGMGIAHCLFHIDSRNILSYLNLYSSAVSPDRMIGHRELSILLCSVLMRNAGQDWYEQGDVWSKVTEKRPISDGVPLERLCDIRPGLRKLMTVDVGPESELLKDGGKLVFAVEWVMAFAEAGKALRDKARDGELSRGVRDILAHHIIFHWNRIGLSFREQGHLARMATKVAFEK